MRNHILYAVRQVPEGGKALYLMSLLGPHDEGARWSPVLKHAMLFSSVRDADEFVRVMGIKNGAVVQLAIREAYIIRAVDSSVYQGTPTRRAAASEEEKKRQGIMDTALGAD